MVLFTSLGLTRTSLWQGLLRGVVAGVLLVAGLRRRRIALEQGLAVRHGAGWRGERSMCRSFAGPKRDTAQTSASVLLICSSERIFRSCAGWADQPSQGTSARPCPALAPCTVAGGVSAAGWLFLKCMFRYAEHYLFILEK